MLLTRYQDVFTDLSAVKAGYIRLVISTQPSRDSGLNSPISVFSGRIILSWPKTVDEVTHNANSRVIVPMGESKTSTPLPSVTACSGHGF